MPGSCQDRIHIKIQKCCFRLICSSALKSANLTYLIFSLFALRIFRNKLDKMSKYFGMFCKLNFVFLINGFVCIPLRISWGHFYRTIFSFSFFKDCFFATFFVIFALISDVCFLLKWKKFFDDLEIT